jgi:uncharacterized membrane protein YphA (DoxX/SURF4 family)
MSKGTIMRFLLASPHIYLVLRVGLGSLFVYSGLSKSFDLIYFAGIINAFGILSESMCFPAAILIVAAELVLGMGLIFDKRGCLLGMLIMLMGFMAVAGYAIYMGYDIDCGCFGPGDPAGEAFSQLRMVLYRDMVMVAVIAYLWQYRNRRRSIGAK